MNRKFFLLAIVFCCSNMECKLANCFVPEDTVIAVSFGGVVGQFDFGSNGLTGKLAQWTALGAIAYWLCGGKVVAALASLPTLAFVDFGLRTLKFKHESSRWPVVEQMWDHDTLLRLCKPGFVSLSSMFVPNVELLIYLKELKEKGFTVVLASNIGPEALESIIGRYPDLFSCFDGLMTPNSANNWLDKKQPEKYFEQLYKEVVYLGKSQLVFIDKKLENCHNARLFANKFDVNISVLQFQTTAALQTDLAALVCGSAD